MKKVILFLAATFFNLQAYALTPIPGSNFKVNLIAARNYTASDLVRLNAAIQAVEQVMNSQELRDKILNFTYQGQKTFVQNNGLSNEQIYNLLMTGQEHYPQVTAPDQTMDVEFQLYKPKWYQSKRVIGYTDQSYRTIYVNSTYFRKAPAHDIADNMVHEWTHKVGFDHDFNSTARRPSSVPYAVGYIVDDLVAALNLF